MEGCFASGWAPFRPFQELELGLAYYDGYEYEREARKLAQRELLSVKGHGD